MDDSLKTIERMDGLLRKRPLNGFEIFVEESSRFEAESRDGRVEGLEVSRTWGLALRVLDGSRMGFSYLTSPGSSPVVKKEFAGGLERTIEEALASARVTSPDACCDLALPLPGPLPDLPIFDRTLEEISEKKKIDQARLLEEAARSADPHRITKVRKASYRDGLTRRRLVNSNGLDVSYAVTFASISVTPVAEEAGESEVGWEFGFSHFFEDLEAMKVGLGASRRALEKLGGRRIPTGTYRVLLRNHVAADFLSLVAHAFLAEQVQKGKSPLSGEKGQGRFSPLISMVDDGLLPAGAAAAPVDGEGTLSQRTPLVVQGVVTGYLYDRFWANRENASFPASCAASTGNSRRSGIKVPPGLGVSNVFVEPGTVSSSDLVASVDRGLVLDEVMGLHTVDPISGDFSLGCSGHWVEGGRRAHPVKSVAVAGNLFELFGKVIGVGDDLRFFGAVGSPSLLVHDLNLSGNG